MSMEKDVIFYFPFLSNKKINMGMIDEELYGSNCRPSRCSNICKMKSFIDHVAVKDEIMTKITLAFDKLFIDLVRKHL